MSKANANFKDYVVYNHNMKINKNMEVVKSGLTRIEAKEMCIKLGTGHGFARQQVTNELKSNTKE